MKVGRLTLSDRASAGVYEDLGGPLIEKVLEEYCTPESITWERVLLPDDEDTIARALARLVDEAECLLVITTGGTGPAPRDVTPEATRRVITRELPGFGEIMRVQSFAKVPTSILSRALAGIRGRSLILNLPGNPKAVRECLPPLLPAISEALDHIADMRLPLLNPIRR